MEGILVVLFYYKENLSGKYTGLWETLVDLFSLRKFVTKQNNCFKILFSEKFKTYQIADGCSNGSGNFWRFSILSLQII